MNATEMFKALGYALVREDDDYIIYEKPIDDGENKKKVTFSDQLEGFFVDFEVNYTHDAPIIKPDLFMAIQSKMKELGWLE